MLPEQFVSQVVRQLVPEVNTSKLDCGGQWSNLVTLH